MVVALPPNSKLDHLDAYKTARAQYDRAVSHLLSS